MCQTVNIFKVWVTDDLLTGLSIFSAVRKLARNDANKKMLSDLGAVKILVKVGQTGNEEEIYGKWMLRISYEQSP